MLVRQILGGNAGVHKIAREPDNDSPLLRHGLVWLGASVMRLFLTLQVDSLVIKRMRRRDHPLGRVGGGHARTSSACCILACLQSLM